MKYRDKQGFTLIELIITIVLIGILSVFLSNIILLPINNFFEINKRTQLVSLADQALYKLRLEMSRAAPYSVRTETRKDATSNDSVSVIEFYPSNSAMRYIRKYGTTVEPPYTIDINSKTTQFTVRGKFFDFNPTQDYQVYIYNDNPYGVTNLIYKQEPVITAAQKINVSANPTNIDNLGEYTITINKHQFAGNSPFSIVYFMKSPISYVCDTRSGEITRVSNYTPTATILWKTDGGYQKPTFTNGQADILVKQVKSCEFYWDTYRRFLLVNLQLKDEISGTTTLQMYDLIFSNTML